MGGQRLLQAGSALEATPNTKVQPHNLVERMEGFGQSHTQGLTDSGTCIFVISMLLSRMVVRPCLILSDFGMQSFLICW